jgi:hypothetical protein
MVTLAPLQGSERAKLARDAENKRKAPNLYEAKPANATGGDVEHVVTFRGYNG